MIHRKTGINGALGGGALMGEEKFYRGGEFMKGLRLILIPLLVAVFLLGVVQPAGARWGWCPIVEVEGTEVYIEATVLNGDDGDYEAEAALYLPPGTNYEVIEGTIDVSYDEDLEQRWRGIEAIVCVELTGDSEQDQKVMVTVRTDHRTLGKKVGELNEEIELKVVIPVDGNPKHPGNRGHQHGTTGSDGDDDED